uniref:J domain-containing protein n=1 Tax=Cryptomonas curvata TaxID=233186 RepID=A0A7S0M0B2_9CRYP|mmetsp:Transcript_15177/g.32395  ORF Transcript_15177/g.32395 Transcript_15177/m.32395 type:complete len:247 (+) Transcript_15177:75-815(+)
MAHEDPWRILGIPPNSSAEDIRAAYRDLAKRWHPDRHGPAERALAEAEFKRVQQAYGLVTGRDRPAWPRWTAEAPRPQHGPPMTNAQAVALLAALGGATTAGIMLWNWYRGSASTRQTDSDEIRERGRAYTAQLQHWKDTLAPEEVAVRREELKTRAIANAVTEGCYGAAQWGAAGSTVALLAKGAERSGVLGRLPQNPFFAFHLRPPIIFFYVSSLAATGFWVRGCQTISPRGSRHVMLAGGDRM